MSTGGDGVAGWDFFISYTAADQQWAEWVAWQLEAAHYRVLIQAWDFVPGSNWQVKMQEGVTRAIRTIALLSNSYLNSFYGQQEWQIAQAADPAGLARKLLPIRIEDCDRPGLLGAVVSIDLFDLTDSAARLRLVAAVRGALEGRAKPDVEPEFPVRPRQSPPTPPAIFPDQQPSRARAVNLRQTRGPVTGRTDHVRPLVFVPDKVIKAITSKDTEATGIPAEAKAFGAAVGTIGRPSNDPPPTGEAEARILGKPTVNGPGRPDPDQVDLLTEIIVYLALHREGKHSQFLSTEIGGGDVDGDLVAATLAGAHQWLGTDAAGQPRIALESGVWRLSSDVRCDWELFVAYAHRAGRDGSGDRAADLTTALRLVSGPLWTELPAGRYRWATASPIARRTRASVVDVAHQLAQLTLGCGDTITALAACRTGLRGVPSSEVLWRDLLQTVAARGERRTLEAVAAEMYRTIGADKTRRGERAETDALVQTLLPGFRYNTA